MPHKWAKLLALSSCPCQGLEVILSRHDVPTTLGGGDHHCPCSTGWSRGLPHQADHVSTASQCIATHLDPRTPRPLLLFPVSGNTARATSKLVLVTAPTWKLEILGSNFSFSVIKLGDLGRPHSLCEQDFPHLHKEEARFYLWITSVGSLMAP